MVYYFVEPFHFVILFVAVVMEMIWVEGKGVPHIVCGLGNTVSVAEKLLYAPRKLNGLLLVLLLVPGVFVVAHVALDFMADILPLYVAVSVFLTYQVLAGSLLIRTGQQVFEFLEAGELEQARDRLTWLVGRDTQDLSPQEIRQAALESMAENLSDGMIAPMFYFLIAGVPGMLAYKMINTLDSRLGYKNEKYREFGYFPAKLDDLANWIPARLTALLMAFSAPRSLRRTLRFIYRYGRAHLSPNAGYPEAALAGILDCRFGGPHDYGGVLVEKDYIGEREREFVWKDVLVATRVNRTAVVLFLMMFFILMSGLDFVVRWV